MFNRTKKNTKRPPVCKGRKAGKPPKNGPPLTGKLSLVDDYLVTKQALVAIARAFKRYMDYSVLYDAHLVGLLNESEFINRAEEKFPCYPAPDEAALSDRVEIVLRESGLELYPDELATMFDVPEDQIDRVLGGLAEKGVVAQMRGD